MPCSTPCSITYRDELPDGCPLDEAEVIAEKRILYHFTFDPIDSEDDFQSQHQKKPTARWWTSADYCKAHGLTMWDDLEVAKRELSAAQQHWSEGKVGKIWAARRICEVELDNGAGAILQTYRPHHWTWWPASGYDIKAHATVLP